MKPFADRSYFYVVHGTRHAKGLLELGGAEGKAVEEQEQVRLSTQQRTRIERTGRGERLSAAEEAGGPRTFQTERNARIEAARTRFQDRMASRTRVECQDAVATILELPLVWESDLERLMTELQQVGRLGIESLAPGQRLPRPDCVLIWRSPGPSNTSTS